MESQVTILYATSPTLKNNGSSAIDYSLCINELFECIDNYMVLPINELSDHSNIITVFKEGIPLTKVEPDEYKWDIVSNRFKWNTRNQNDCKFVLGNNVVLINEISQRIDSGLINST